MSAEDALLRRIDETIIMQHLNSFCFYELAAKLHTLLGLAAQNRVSDLFGALTEAQAVLDDLIKGDPLPLEASKMDAQRLLKRLGNLFDKYFIDPSTQQIRKKPGEDRVDPHEMALIGSLVEKFEHALAADLNRAPVYAAEKRGIYSTYDLIENADQTFSKELRKTLLPESMEEFNLAGRALAFGMGSAAGMHLLRSIEMTLRAYYEEFSGAKVKQAERNYNIYLKQLVAMAADSVDGVTPDKRLLQMLVQIKDHYRNPLAATQKGLSIDQALSLFGLASAVITMMAEGITALRRTGGSSRVVSEDGEKDFSAESQREFSKKNKKNQKESVKTAKKQEDVKQAQGALENAAKDSLESKPSFLDELLAEEDEALDDGYDYRLSEAG